MLKKPRPFNTQIVFTFGAGDTEEIEMTESVEEIDKKIQSQILIKAHAMRFVDRYEGIYYILMDKVVDVHICDANVEWSENVK